MGTSGNDVGAESLRGRQRELGQISGGQLRAGDCRCASGNGRGHQGYFLKNYSDPPRISGSSFLGRRSRRRRKKIDAEYRDQDIRL